MSVKDALEKLDELKTHTNNMKFSVLIDEQQMRGIVEVYMENILVALGDNFSNERIHKDFDKRLEDIERRVGELEKIMHDHFGVDINNCDKEVFNDEGKHTDCCRQVMGLGEKCICKPFSEVKEEKPDYYYKSKSGYIEYTDADPEVTCWHCGKTFRCDFCDATCRLCSAPFDKSRCAEFKFTPTNDTIQIPRAVAESFLKADSDWGDIFWSAVNEMSNAIKTALNEGK